MLSQKGQCKIYLFNILSYLKNRDELLVPEVKNITNIYYKIKKKIEAYLLHNCPK